MSNTERRPPCDVRAPLLTSTPSGDEPPVSLLNNNERIEDTPNHSEFTDPLDPNQIYFEGDNFPKHLVIRHNHQNLVKDFSPVAVETGIKNCVGNKYYKHINIFSNTQKGLIFLEVGHRISARKLLDTKFLGNIPVVVEVNKNRNTSRGVILCSQLNSEPIPDLINYLSAYGVEDIYAPTKRDDTRSGIYFLTFATPIPPKKVKVGYHIATVRAQKPRQCFKCYKFGHGKNSCRNKDVCSKCSSSEHRHTECTESTPKCPNCDQAHDALNKKCPVYDFESKVLEHIFETGTSLYQARQHCLRCNPALVSSTPALTKMRNAMSESSAERVKTTGPTSGPCQIPNPNENTPDTGDLQIPPHLRKQNNILHDIIKGQSEQIKEQQEQIKEQQELIKKQQTQIDQQLTIMEENKKDIDELKRAILDVKTKLNMPDLTKLSFIPRKPEAGGSESMDTGAPSPSRGIKRGCSASPDQNGPGSNPSTPVKRNAPVNPATTPPKAISTEMLKPSDPPTALSPEKSFSDVVRQESKSPEHSGGLKKDPPGKTRGASGLPTPPNHSDTKPKFKNARFKVNTESIPDIDSKPTPLSSHTVINQVTGKVQTDSGHNLSDLGDVTNL